MLVVTLALVGLALGCVDAAMTAHAASVEAAYRRSIMASFFAVFSLAGILGAGLAAIAAGTSLSLGAFFALLAVVLVPAHLIAGPALLRTAAPAPGAGAERPRTRVPWRSIVIIGIALTCTSRTRPPRTGARST